VDFFAGSGGIAKNTNKKTTTCVVVLLVSIVNKG
jgi:hypothetical protein